MLKAFKSGTESAEPTDETPSNEPELDSKTENSTWVNQDVLDWIKHGNSILESNYFDCVDCRTKYCQCEAQMIGSENATDADYLQAFLQRILESEEEIQEVVNSMHSGWLGTGQKVVLFEEEFIFADKL